MNSQGLAYEPVAGQLTFAAGEEEAVVEVKINPTHQYDITEDFRLYLKDPIGGATLDSTTDGGADANICTIFIKGDLEVRHMFGLCSCDLRPIVREKESVGPLALSWGTCSF